MPIYAYRCTSCGHAKDVLRKISDPPLSVCPACGEATFAKQLTAAGFQLKGSGWYVTDFRGDKNARKPSGTTEGAAAAAGDAATGPASEGAGVKPAGEAATGKPASPPAGDGAASKPAAAAPAAPSGSADR
jgi:putative FmdB family regulatory protein